MQKTITVVCGVVRSFNHEEREDGSFVSFVVTGRESRYGFDLAEKLNEMPPEMARLVLFASSGLESVRPTPT